MPINRWSCNHFEVVEWIKFFFLVSFISIVKLVVECSNSNLLPLNSSALDLVRRSRITVSSLLDQRWKIRRSLLSVSCAINDRKINSISPNRVDPWTNSINIVEFAYAAAPASHTLKIPPFSLPTTHTLHTTHIQSLQHLKTTCSKFSKPKASSFSIFQKISKQYYSLR